LIWFESTPLSASRALADDELAWLRRAQRGALRKCGAAVALAVVSPVAIGVAVSLISAAPEVIAAALLVWFLLLLPCGILLFRDGLRRRRALRRDAKDNCVWDFSGAAVLPHARLVVAPPERRGRPARLGCAAERPASTYQVPFEVRDERTQERRQGSQRHLSPEEAAELAGHAGRPIWRWFDVALGAWLGMALFAVFESGNPPEYGAAALFILVLRGNHLFKNFRARTQLRRDLDTGAAIAVPPKPGEIELEFLRESHALWTVGGAPAPWRLSPLPVGADAAPLAAV
jgi:hypothetical protein